MHTKNIYVQADTECVLHYCTSVLLHIVELFSPLALNLFCFHQRPVCFYKYCVLNSLFCHRTKHGFHFRLNKSLVLFLSGV